MATLTLENILPLADIEAALSIPTDSKDTLLGSLRKTAIAMAARFIGLPVYDVSDADNPFLSAAVTDERIDGEQSKYLHLSRWPVTAVSDIKDGDGESYGYTEGDDFYILDDITLGKYWARLQKVSGYWIEGRGNYQVSYTAGFDQETDNQHFPQGLREAILEIVKDLYNVGAEAGIASKKIGAKSVTYISRNGAMVTERAAGLLYSYIPGVC